MNSNRNANTGAPLAPKEGIMFQTTATAAGAQAAADVVAGIITDEQAGDQWVTFADRSHTAGIDWQRGYDDAIAKMFPMPTMAEFYSAS